MTAALSVGTVVAGDANAFPSGEEATVNQGNISIDISTDVPVTGQVITSTLNSVTTKADANVIPTGVTLSTSVGNALVRWSNVPQGDLATWTEVPQGSSSTWTEVNQGSSNPWTEVDTAA